MTTPTGRTGSSAQSSLPSRPAGAPGRRLRRSAWAAAGTVALVAAGVAGSGAASATPAARPAAKAVYLSSTAAVPGTHADFADGRNAAGKEVVWRYSGSAWKTVKFSLASDQYLTGVAATSSTHAWLVGETDSATSNTLMEAWNGSSFKVQSAGVIKDAAYDGVTASSAGAWVWGTQSTDEGTSIILEHWNGHAWAKASTSGLAAGTTIVNMATSGSQTWILASSSLGGGSSYVLFRWTGSAWKSVSYPGETNPDVVLESIAVGGGSNAAVAGYIGGTTATGIALHWNGSKWSSYSLAKDDYGLSAGAAGGDAWVGGERNTGELEATASLVRWTGHSFASIHLAGTGNKFSDIASIAANSPTDAIAIGGVGPNACEDTGALIEKLTGSTWSAQKGSLPQVVGRGLTPYC